MIAGGIEARCWLYAYYAHEAADDQFIEYLLVVDAGRIAYNAWDACRGRLKASEQMFRVRERERYTLCYGDTLGKIPGVPYCLSVVTEYCFNRVCRQIWQGMFFGPL